MAAQMRESSIPRCHDRAGYSVAQVGFLVKNYWQIAGGSKPQREAALGSTKPGFGPRIPTGVPELVDLEEALVFLRRLKPVYARAVDVFIAEGCDIKAASRRLGVPYRTTWGHLGRAYELLAEFM